MLLAKDRYIDQWNKKRESKGRPTHIWPIYFDREVKVIQWIKNIL